jgi:hypothetical protein
VPTRPGLYPIYGDAKTWMELGLGEPSDRRPLYIGKAEDNLATRDLKTHFGDRRTGQSTERRSFAALLHDTLGFRIPRNPAKLAHFSNYGLSPEHDAALTAWTRERPHLAVWEKPLGCRHPLTSIEVALILEWLPPLSLDCVITPWTSQVKAARAVMARGGEGVGIAPSGGRPV